MAEWRKTINIKPILRRDQSNETSEHAAAIAQEVAALVRSRVAEPDTSFRLLDALETMEGIEPTDDDALATFNSALSELYDWADAERVWLGL